MSPLTNRHRMATTSILAAGCLGVLGLGTAAIAQQSAGNPTAAVISRTQAWDPTAIDAFRHLPVQHGDRVKPFASAMGLILLQCNGKRSIRVPDEPDYGELAGRSLTPTAWAMDALFHPQQADHYACFEVSDSTVLEDLGLRSVIKSRRARYSYAELQPATKALIAKERDLASTPPDQLSSLQRQTLRLCSSFSLYGRLRDAARFTQARFAVDTPISLSQAFDGASKVRFSALVERMPRLIALWKALRSSGTSKEDSAALAGVLRQLATVLRESDLLRLVPPVTVGETTWMTLYDLARASDRPEMPDLSGAVEYLRRFEAVADASASPEFAERAVLLQQHGRSLAEAAGSYGKLGLEVRYNRWDLFYRGLLGFVVSFLIVAMSWLVPKRRWPWRLANLTALISLGLVVTGITMRCMIRGRPPVTNLYETILFVTAGGVCLGLVMELLNRRRVAISVASALGVGGLFLASRYEMREVSDTMTPLVAVLDTNFWLATHVTTVTMGYLAGLLAGLLAYVYLIGKLLVRSDKHQGLFRDIGRMVYGVLCFGAFFATLGTVLGGIWANESWGRFWGWDPKENGALLIVIYMLFILHGRMGGYFRDFGVCTLAVLGNAVVAWSWWGVNELNTGLHSYGTIQGVTKWLMIFYSVQVAVVLPGLLMKLLHHWRGDNSGKPMGAA